MKKIIVVSNVKEWDISSMKDIDVVASTDYLMDKRFVKHKELRIFNLCNDYRYQGKGYYVSLLAEARGHRVIPDVTTIQDLKSPALVKSISDDLEDLIQKNLHHLKSDTFTLSIYFGKNVASQYDQLCKELYHLFQAPLLRAKFVFNKTTKMWILQGLRAISVHDIPESHWSYVKEFARDYFSQSRYTTRKSNTSLYDLGILYDPHETSPPSGPKALKKFMEVGEKMGFSVSLITREDFSWLGEFDALFIRETTSVHHHTYRFARKAEAEGLAVIDAPSSILRCANKVYLAELLAKAKVPTPKTLIVQSEHEDALIAEQIGFPCVLKVPDSSFSRGVIKVQNAEELREALQQMLANSALILAQAYNPTDYDWRIGVLDGHPLFACKYYMAKDHWQIYNWTAKNKNTQEGNCDTLPIPAVPKRVISVAVKAARLIGLGLYGVDVKEIEGQGPCVIEINDNPNIDVGIEDAVLGDQLYVDILRSLADRIKERRYGRETGAFKPL